MIAGRDAGVEYFGPEHRILREEIPLQSSSEVENPPSGSKCEEIMGLGVVGVFMLCVVGV